MKALTAERLPPWMLHPYRLVSLGEIMRRFHPEVYVKFAEIFGVTSGAMSAYDAIEKAVAKIGTVLPITFADTPLPSAVTGPDGAALLREFEKELNELGASSSADAAGRMSGVLLQSTCTWAKFNFVAVQLKDRLKDDLSRRLFFSLSPAGADRFEQPLKDWGAVLDRFSSTQLDVEECSKCLALRRYMASAFHSMRILEIGLNVLAKTLQVPCDHTNWHIVIEQITAKVKGIDPGWGTDWKDQQQFYSEAATHFMFLKDAWRNHVMHVRHTYDEERATAICGHVQAFMRHLATRLRE